MILDLKINCKNSTKRREEMLNLRNKACQEAFREETDKNQDLLNCFKKDFPFEKQFNEWKDIFDNILKKCFKTVRICKKKKHIKTEEMLLQRIKLKNEAKREKIDDEMRVKINQRIKQIENDIGEEIAENNFKDVIDTMKELGEGSNINGTGRKKFWDLLKRKYPKNLSAVPVGKKDSSGKMVTEHEELKHLYLETYNKKNEKQTNQRTTLLHQKYEKQVI